MSQADDRTTKTTCPYCGVGCGVLATIDKESKVSIKGDSEHPANFGKLCSKGLTLAETLGPQDRLLFPQINGNRASWNDALNIISEKLSNTIQRYGPDALAFYVSGQCLTEDYYVANKLMKGYIGSGNIDTNSRLCMASSVVGHKRAFGADIMPGCYEDLEEADLIVLTGSNLAWCHPILYQRIAAEKNKRPNLKIIVIDPRETATCDIADLHLDLAPSSDVALFQGLLHYLNIHDHQNSSFVKNHTENVTKAVEATKTYSIDKVSRLTHLSQDNLNSFYRSFAETERVVTIYSQGVNQAKDGSDRVNTILNCHLFTGRIGKPGSSPFSVTGQPNAMGGREVGGLANQLASHMDIENPTHRDLLQRFWQSPRMVSKTGLKAVDMFNAIHNGEVKAIWIMATNPVDSMPDADFVKAALDKCDLVIVSDIYGHTDTVACADIVLPSTGWGEKDGIVTNSERRISRQKSFLPAPGEAKDDWWQLCEVAKKMGFQNDFDFNSPAEIFREYAMLCSFENNGQRDLDLSAFSDLSDAEYENLSPVQWPVTSEHPNGLKRFFTDGHFYTDTNKAQFFVPQKTEQLVFNPNYPFVLNTGRIRDQWHTMTRTGRASRLSGHIAEPFVQIHPKDAEALGLEDADLAQIKTEQGEMLARVGLTKRQRCGSVFVPMHFTNEFTSKGRVDALTAAVTDPVSGQPAFKSTPAAIEKFTADWYGFSAVSSSKFIDISVPLPTEYWAKTATDNGIRIELAGLTKPENWVDYFCQILNMSTEDIDVLEISTSDKNDTRLGAFSDGRLIGLLFIANAPVSVSRDWVCQQLLRKITGPDRHRLLAGRPGADMPDKGAIVCACMNIGMNELRDAIISGCKTVTELGEKTTAGTNCGSCQPELRTIIEETRLVPAS